MMKKCERPYTEISTHVKNNVIIAKTACPLNMDWQTFPLMFWFLNVNGAIVNIIAINIAIYKFIKKWKYIPYHIMKIDGNQICRYYGMN